MKYYLIRYKGEPAYVGSTKIAIERRLEQHFAIAPRRQRCRLYQAILKDPQDWTIELLEESNGNRKATEKRLKEEWNTPYNETRGLC